MFVTTAGHFTRWHVWSGFYDVQADALLHGQLHLLEQPSRALLALKDPFDIANMPYWRWDHLLYNGHLYHYWGIVPAFLVAGIRLIFRVGGPADNVLTFAFFVVRLVAGTLLIRDVARRATPRPPKWAVAAAMLVFALANPTPYTLARGAIYEAAIMAGVAFMTAGLYCGYRSMHAPGGRAATAWLAAASLGFGLAAGSRLNLMPTAVALAVLGTLWRWWQIRSQGPARLAAPARSAGVRPPERTTVAHRACGAGRLVATGVAGLVPAGAVMLGLLIINKLRFGAWTDFGRDYAMTYPLFVPGLRFLLPNTYAYAFAPPQWGCTFPYLSLAWNAVRPLTPAWLPVTWPADHFTPRTDARPADDRAVLLVRAARAADRDRAGAPAARRGAGPARTLGGAAGRARKLVVGGAGDLPARLGAAADPERHHDALRTRLRHRSPADRDLRQLEGARRAAAPRRASSDRLALRAAGGVDDRRGSAARLHRLLQALRTPQPRPPPHPARRISASAG